MRDRGVGCRNAHASAPTSYSLTKKLLIGPLGRWTQQLEGAVIRLVPTERRVLAVGAPGELDLFSPEAKRRENGPLWF